MFSHIRPAERYMAYGKNAQIQVAHRACRSPMLLRAMKYTGMHVSAENTAFSPSSTIADVTVNSPNTLNTPAISVGYTGASHAVGPVCGSKGEANPLPVTNDRATIPISQANRQCPRQGSSRSAYRNGITHSRTTSPHTIAVAMVRVAGAPDCIVSALFWISGNVFCG